MSGKSIVDQIKHYQKDIERCPDNSDRMIRCIQRLYVLPIRVEHLQETGVGRSVNSLRKYKGDVGDAAKALVAKWKAMVAAEESGDETHDIKPYKQQQENKVSHSLSQIPVAPPLSVKTEQKTDHHSSKERSKNHTSENKKHHSESKSHHSDSKSHSTSKTHDKNNSSSSKKSHSSSNSTDNILKSNSTNHVSVKKDSSHKSQKSNHDNKHRSDSDESPPHKKHKNHHSHSRNSLSSVKKKEPVKSESEDESSSSEESEESETENSQPSHSEREVEGESDNSNLGVESDSSSSSDHRHRSKHKSSHHRHSKSSHSKDKDNSKHKDHKDKSREKEKHKEHNHNKNHKPSSSKTDSSPDYKELIKENEKKVKREKEEFAVPKSLPLKNVKLERNEDGSIDSESGASFADALLGMDSFSEPKKKKKSPISTSNSGSSTSSHKKSSKSSSTHDKNEGSSSKFSKPSSSSKSKSIDELVEPPDLLSKKIKLEALDLDISSTLPEINLNYKPLPHIPESIRKPSKAMTEEAMFSLMTTKNQRTKVFSGNKVYQTTVPSLFSLCIQLLYDNIDAVEYTGGVPYNLLKPLLEKLNADQLYVLEHFNPYLIEDTDELWKFHCSKDFRSEKRQDLETWRELYLRCLEEREKKLKALTANITQSMAKSTPVRQAKLAYVDAVVKPPRSVARKQAKYGTGNSTPSSKSPTKQEIVSKALVGGNTPGVSVKDVVPTPPPVARAAAHHPTPTIMKKKKAPLMQKALQVMKGTRYKR